MISFGQPITMAKSGSRNCKKIGVFLFVLMSLSYRHKSTQLRHIVKLFDSHLLFLSIKGGFLIIIYLICLFYKWINPKWMASELKTGENYFSFWF